LKFQFAPQSITNGSGGVEDRWWNTTTGRKTGILPYPPSSMTQPVDTNPSTRHTAPNLSARQSTGFFDHIRLVLTALVILHHSAIMFGAPGGWYLKYETTHLLERVISTVFVSVDQAFFMGFFFLLAGYFSVASYDRKGPLPFLRDRAIRLGIPILAYGYVLGPMTVALAHASSGQPFLEHWARLTRAGYFNIGPLWFAFALLLFSFAYVLWRVVARRAGDGAGFVPRQSHLLAAAVATGVLSFVLRLWVPVGQERWTLQIAYFSSYVVLFVSGCATARSRWLEHIDGDTARVWRITAWICAPLLFVYGVAAGAVRGEPFDTSGGWTLPALAYAFWEPFVAWGIILGMLWRFRLNAAQRAAWSDWAGCAYAAYILHPPIVVTLGLLLARTALSNSVCFVIAGSAGILLSFLLGRLALLVPGARRVL
jgi:fucose 4-O-acetylase-like acetyltransferase